MSSPEERPAIFERPHLELRAKATGHTGTAEPAEHTQPVVATGRQRPRRSDHEHNRPGREKFSTNSNKHVHIQDQLMYAPLHGNYSKEARP